MKITSSLLSLAFTLALGSILFSSPCSERVEKKNHMIATILFNDPPPSPPTDPEPPPPPPPPFRKVVV